MRSQNPKKASKRQRHKDEDDENNETKIPSKKVKNQHGKTEKKRRHKK